MDVPSKIIEILKKNKVSTSILSFCLDNLMSNGYSIRKKVNLFDSQVLRFNRFYKTRQGVSLEELSKKDVQTLTKILNALKRDEEQLNLYIVQREEWTNKLSKFLRKVDAKAD